MTKYSLPNIKSPKSILYYFLKGRGLSVLRLGLRNKDKISPIKDDQRLSYLRAKQTKQLKGEYDVAISSAEFYCNYLVEMKVSAKKKIAWIHPDLSKLNIDVKLSNKVISSFASVCLVSKDCLDSFVKIFPQYSDKAVVIENMIDQLAISRKAQEPIEDGFFSCDSINIVTVCRIDNSSKRLDRIVRTCKVLKDCNVNYIWNIIGDGSDLEYIKRLAKKEEVLDSLHFLGAKSNPYPYVSRSDVFVLSSQYEGKPIVVDEALCLHIPCIVSDYKSAVGQVDNRYGAVLPNDDELFVSSFISVLSKDNINKWKSNLSSYIIDNTKIEAKIDQLIES